MRENKSSNNKENHGVINSTSKKKKKKKKKIVGDSMIKHVNGCEVSKDDLVKSRWHPGASTNDITDYVRPTACRKPDMIIIHTSTNDIQNTK